MKKSEGKNDITLFNVMFYTVTYMPSLNALSIDGPPKMDSLGNKRKVQIQLQTNPLLPAKISVDGNMFTAPTTINLTSGPHLFSAISNVADPNTPYITYTFQYWKANGTRTSNNATTIITIMDDTVLTAQYMLGQSGWGAPARPDSLPNPNGPMTPNLILRNPSLDAYKEV
jgi:hypothetical protein